jgi:hypothetical protein
MYRYDSPKLPRSVRLYPRIAATNSAGQASRVQRRRVHRAASTDEDADPATKARAEVQARLLRMILDNEQLRRNVQRPTQV